MLVEYTEDIDGISHHGNGYPVDGLVFLQVGTDIKVEFLADLQELCLCLDG